MTPWTPASLTLPTPDPARKRLVVYTLGPQTVVSMATFDGGMWRECLSGNVLAVVAWMEVPEWLPG